MQRICVSCCDWMMLKRQKLGAITLSKEIGCEGLEMDMGPLGKRIMFDNRFRPKADSLSVCEKDYAAENPEEVKKFKGTADSLGIEVSSIAMSGFYAQNFLTRDNYRDLIQDCLNTMKVFGAKVAYLPLGGSGQEWKEYCSDDFRTLIYRLYVAGEMARKAGVVIGIRTGMPLDFNIDLLNAVGSEGIKIYYSIQDACDNNRDYINEIKRLGKNRICQIHISNTDGVTLRNDPEVNMPAIIATLREIGYNGYLTVERSRNAKDVRNVRGNYGDNVKYLHEVAP